MIALRPFTTLFTRAVTPFLLAAASHALPMTSIEPTLPQPESSDLARLVSPSDPVVDALLEGRTKDALAELDRLETNAPENADAWAVYRSEAWARAGELEKALDALDQFETRFPNSPWRAKARFHRAEVARSLKRFGDAEVILREEAAILRSAARRVELGEEILRAASEIEEAARRAPSEERRSLLDGRAHLLLVEALRLETTDAFKLDTNRRLTQLALRGPNWHEARTRADALAELLGEGSLERAEAKIVAARAHLMMGDADDARLTLMRVERRLGEAMDAGASETDLSTAKPLRALALAYLGDAWRQSGRPLFALDAWQRLRESSPSHPETARTAVETAIVLREVGRTGEALKSWEAIEALPESRAPEETSEAPSLTAALALAIERSMGRPGPDLSAHKRTARIERARLLLQLDRHDDAISVFRSYVTDFPGAEDWSAAQEGIVTARYERAQDLLERSENPSRTDLAAAEQAALEFADEYPLDHRAGEALMQWAGLPQAYATKYLSDAGDEGEQLELRGVTVARLQEVSRRLERSDPNRSSQALFGAALLLQMEAEDPSAAIALYRRVQGSYAGAAAERLREMQDEVLRVRTPKLARPGQPITVEVDVRNIEAVTVQAVKLDLTQYFQRHGEAGGIERLDLDLIAPDVEKEIPIEDYERFANLTRTIEVPVSAAPEEPGVYAVTVVAAGKRATTLCVRSSIDLIVRRSDAEVFALVTEVDGAGKARVAEGVDVTLSYEHDGKRETTSLVTDKGGVASFRAPKGARFGASTNIIAAHGASIASTEIEGRASGQAIALQSRAHIQTDRSAYRAGDDVRFRAVLREVSADQDGSTWKIPSPSKDAGRPFRTELLAPGGMVVSTVTATSLTAHGTLSGEFRLDDSAPSGTWTLRTTAPSGLSATERLTVGEIAVPRTRLTVEAARPAVLRGETIELTAVAETAWGAPLVNVPIAWTDPQGVEALGRTNEEGVATFQAETIESLEGARLQFQARLPENENLSASTTVLVALSALEVSISTEESVVLAGETFNARVTAVATAASTEKNATGNARDVRVIGVRSFPKRGGRFGEETFLDRVVQTDETGAALLPIEVSQGGNVSLRAIAVDRLGREVESTAAVFVSGEEDAERLRVLASETSIFVGDQGTVRVVDRSERGGLALMTVEATTVLEHRVIQLDSGVTEVSFDASTTHVPDVQVSIAAIRDTRFYSSAATFRVQRPMVLTVEASGDPLDRARPGETRELVIRTTDGRGNPVAAEVALSLVDQALLRAYPRRSTSLAQAFAIQGSRTPSFLSGASAGFHYDGTTTEIDEAILEEDRREEARAATERMRGSVGESLSDLGDDALEEAFDESAFGVAAQAPAPLSAVNRNSVLGVGGGAGGRKRGRMSKKPARPAAAPEVELSDPTAFWNASIETGKDGVARVSLPIPLQEATWQLDAAAASADHRFGETRQDIVVTSPMVAIVDAPTYLMEGDQPALRAEVTLESPAETDTAIELELRVAGLPASEEGPGSVAPRQSVQRATVTVPKGSTRVAHAFDALPPVPSVGGLSVELSAKTSGSANPLTAADSRGVVVRPRGYLVTDTSAGQLTAETTIQLSVGGADAQELTLVAGATEAGWLVRAALQNEMARRPLAASRANSALALSSQLHGIAELLDAAARSGGLDAASVAALRARADGLIGGLIGRVSEDGGWARDSGAWRGLSSRESDPRTTARAILGLTLAQRAGVQVPAPLLEGALAFAGAALTNADSDEERAHLAWALEVAGPGADLALGRLHRERARLGRGALSALALALVAADRAPMAREVAELIRVNEGDDKSGRPVIGSPLEGTALAVLARTRAGVGDGSEREALQAQAPWFEPVGRGAAVAASAASGALASASSSQSPVTFEVTVGKDGPAQTIQLRPESGGVREVLLSIPGGSAEGGVTVRLKPISGPALDYALLLEGYADKAPAPAPNFPVWLGDVRMDEAVPRWRGQVLDEGFSCVSSPSDERWYSTVDAIAFGESARVVVPLPNLRLPSASDYRTDLELEVPLPAGASASVGGLPSGVQASIVDGALLVNVPFGRGGNVIVDLVGVRPGTWCLSAPLVRSADDPALMAYGKESQLVVLASREGQRDRRATPDELLSLGRKAFEADAMDEALAALRPLFSEWKSRLRPHSMAEVARLLLFASLKAEAAGSTATDDRALVDYFEILKERDPDLFVSFDDTLRIAAAYRSIGEAERACLLLKAVIDETLGEDLRVAAAFDSADEWMRASLMGASIWRRYPDSPAAEDADFALASRLIERGLDASGAEALPAAARSALVLNGITRLRRQASMADPRGTVAKDAGLALVTTYAQLEQWERAASRAERFGAAFDDPIYRDSFRYSEAVARWSDRNGPEDAESRATEILEDLAQNRLKMKDGSQRWSPNRDLALYILAQVYHAGKDTDRAAAYYDRVDHAFSDAAEALSELRSERLQLAEDVVRVAPGEAADVLFDHKGIDSVEVLVYPVDLLTLVLRERDLSRVTAVDLAGVAPTLETSIDLERSVLRPSEGSIQVKLEAPGAYLAMLRGGDLHRSALLLATDLELDVVLSGGGSVRAQAMLASTDTFAEGVSVRILGDGEGGVRSLDTDRRGVASAVGVNGRVTVIARASQPSSKNPSSVEQHYAFFGGPVPEREEAPEPQERSKEMQTQYFSNVIDQNSFNTAARSQRVIDDVNRERKGVQVQQAK